MERRRRFSSKERTALYLIAGGRCGQCGTELQPGWHADHIVPWSKDGETDVINGQALCPTCNLRKGDTMLPNWNMPLRNWQQRAHYAYIGANSADFLLVATPGSGKTITAARIAHDLLGNGRVERLVIVCPTDHLKRQWAKSLSRFGISIDPEWKNGDGVVGKDYHGIAVTYATVAKNPSIHRHHCRRPTMLIADEVHHAGDGNSWGDGLRQAFEPAIARLLLSGTPFRTDKSTIPFVPYTEEQDGTRRSKADFSYGYGDALRDDICRPVLFPSYEGTMEWSSNFEMHTASFRDEIPEPEARRRLRTALDPQGEWISTVLRDADQKLRELRHNGQPDAGGLVICIDQAHAKKIAAKLRKVAGEEPVIVISEDPDATRELECFSKGRQKWVIAVRMLSEGVDIPRLQVGVYATNIIAELFFRQVIGRFVRVTTNNQGQRHPEEQSAYLFLPREEQLIVYAQRVKEERDHELFEEIEDITGDLGKEKPERTAKQSTLFAPIGAEAFADDVFFDHLAIPQAEISVAATLKERSGLTVDAVQIAHLFRLANKPLVEAAPQPEAKPEPEEEPLFIRKKKQGKVLKRVITQLVQASGQDYSHWYMRLMAHDGVRNPDATEEQLTKRIEIAMNWLEGHRRG